MKPIGKMSAEEVAGLVCEALQKAGVSVTLTGGACVAIWSQGKYVSNDLDFIEEGPVPPQKARSVMLNLGFKKQGRHYVHPETAFFVEFPTGPLMLGNQRVHRVTERKTRAGNLRLLSPTDCVKDRLAAFFHWNDRQSLEQALLVAQAQAVDLESIRSWSASERNEEKFRMFEQRLRGLVRSRKSGSPRRPPGTSFRKSK